MRVGERRKLHSTILPAAVLLGLLVVFFHKFVFSNLILARGDTFLYFYPYWHAAADALRQPRLPFWNPAIFMGAPLLSNSQAGFFYPPNWPLWLLLQTPYAVKASILLHLFLAAAGVYLVARRVLHLGRPAALLSAAVFSLGGYLTAQIEHVNQVQGLAWLPWLLLAVSSAKVEKKRSRLLALLLVGAFFALQLLAGHTQTAFISGVGLSIWLLGDMLLSRLAAPTGAGPQLHASIATFAVLVGGVLLALGLSAVQLAPMLELTHYSSRRGGLPPNEVMSFSLPPHVLTRALLPTYGQSLFSEYVAFVPLTILALAFVAAWQWRRQAGTVASLALTLTGLFLALGAYNPVYWLLARLPGFDLFRAPARWLVLYALGLALLAGLGWELLWRLAAESGDRETWRGHLRSDVLPAVLLCVLTVLLLAIWGFAAGAAAAWLPVGPEAPFEPPSASTVVGWMVELALLVGLGAACYFARTSAWRRMFVASCLLAGLAAAFLASLTLPHNRLTTPEAYFDIRPATARLMAANSQPPDRLLSLSDIFFDPGDQGEISSIYADQLSEQALYDYVVAIKQKEINAPNLPMIYDLASVDGFDGGILPLRAYSELMQAVVAADVEVADGRLREYLDAVPDPRWLDLFNARYLITDKTGDVWRDGVYFDRQHPFAIAGEGATVAGDLPAFDATELWLLASAQPGDVEVITAGGTNWLLEAQPVQDGLYRLAFPQAAVPVAIGMEACPAEQPCVLEAMSLVDTRDGSFQPLTLGNYRLIFSGDVKIYENKDALPRAYLVPGWRWVDDEAAAIAALQSPEFDGRSLAVLTGAPGAGLAEPPRLPPAGEQTAVITSYHPERLTIRTQSATDALLVLSDAYFPGWQAFVDGQATELYTANALFRAVFVPRGEHEVTMRYESTWFLYGLIIFIFSLLTLVVGLLFFVFCGRKKS